jgi:hypothetical protein
MRSRATPFNQIRTNPENQDKSGKSGQIQKIRTKSEKPDEIGKIG